MNFSLPRKIRFVRKKASSYNEKSLFWGELSSHGPTPGPFYQDLSRRPCIIGSFMTKAMRSSAIVNKGSVYNNALTVDRLIEKKIY